MSCLIYLYLLSQEIGCKLCFPNDFFCVEFFMLKWSLQRRVSDWLTDGCLQPSGAVSVDGKSSDASLLSSVVDEVKSVIVSQQPSHAH